MSNNSYYNDQWRIINEKNQNKVSNYSMEFDGTNDKIEFGDVNNFERTDSFSFSLWINISSYGAYYFYISKQLSSGTLAGYNLFQVSNGKLGFILNNTYSSNTLYVTSTSQTPLNQWVHLTLTYDGSSLASGVNMYLNGVPETIITVYNTLTASTLNTTDFQISGRDGGNGDIVGKVDQVSVFDYELSSSQVSTLYGGGTAITNPMTISPKPISYYQLGDQSVDNGANYLVPNNSLQDYVFNFIPTDYIGFANGSTMARQQNISYSAWVNTTNLSTTQYIVGNNGSSNNGTSIFILNKASYPDRLVFQFGDMANFNNQSYFNSIVSNLSTYVSANEWFHVAASWDGTDSKIYINGIERNSWTPTQPPTYTISGWTSFRIGRKGDGAAHFEGMLSNVAFWNSNLTPTQVTTIYNNGTPNDISSLNPTSWWKLNAQDTFDGSNWTINDYGSGSNDGTSSGMTSANLVVSDLQQTSGFSPYALGFDGINDYLDLGTSLSLANEYTISSWININNTTAGAKVIVYKGSNSSYEFALEVNRTSGKLSTLGTSAGPVFTSNTTLAAGVWYHAALTKAVVGGTKTYTFFLNGQPDGTGTTTLAPNYTSGITAIGRFGSSSVGYFNGEISNLALWNSVLTSTQITEIYNQGVPSNLNTFSGTAPIAWWQLGSNSSFNTQWTCLDEIGTNNGVSVNMANDDITNGVGYSANGLGTSSIDIVGDAPYSTANGLSENQDVLDRSTDIPS